MKVQETSRTRRPPFGSLTLVAAGALAAVALGAVALLGDIRFNGSRLVHAAMGRDDLGSDALAAACRAPLVDRLTEKGFQPEEVEFGPAPTVGPPWGHQRSFGDSFTFRDGAGQVRVDGVVACVVAGGKVTVEFRVGSNPHREA